jgi:hypothetical protein
VSSGRHRRWRRLDRRNEALRVALAIEPVEFREAAALRPDDEDSRRCLSERRRHFVRASGERTRPS